VADHLRFANLRSGETVLDLGCCADGTVDIVISNGTLNLSPRRARVLTECARVLKPGGRFCVADLTVTAVRGSPSGRI
jgi:SAM-dependent methyltransferase